MTYTTGAVRQAWTAAMSAGAHVMFGPDDPRTVGVLERLGYLPLPNPRLAHLLPMARDRAALNRSRRRRPFRHHRTVVIR